MRISAWMEPSYWEAAKYICIDYIALRVFYKMIPFLLVMTSYNVRGRHLIRHLSSTISTYLYHDFLKEVKKQWK